MYTQIWWENISMVWTIAKYYYQGSSQISVWDLFAWLDLLFGYLTIQFDFPISIPRPPLTSFFNKKYGLIIIYQNAICMTEKSSNYRLWLTSHMHPRLITVDLHPQWEVSFTCSLRRALSSRRSLPASSLERWRSWFSSCNCCTCFSRWASLPDADSFTSCWSCSWASNSATNHKTFTPHLVLVEEGMKDGWLVALYPS